MGRRRRNKSRLLRHPDSNQKSNFFWGETVFELYVHFIGKVCGTSSKKQGLFTILGGKLFWEKKEREK